MSEQTAKKKQKKESDLDHFLFILEGTLPDTLKFFKFTASDVAMLRLTCKTFRNFMPKGWFDTWARVNSVTSAVKNGHFKLAVFMMKDLGWSLNIGPAFYTTGYVSDALMKNPSFEEQSAIKTFCELVLNTDTNSRYKILNYRGEKITEILEHPKLDDFYFMIEGYGGNNWANYQPYLRVSVPHLPKQLIPFAMWMRDLAGEPTIHQPFSGYLDEKLKKDVDTWTLDCTKKIPWTLEVAKQKRRVCMITDEEKIIEELELPPNPFINTEQKNHMQQEP